MPDAIAALAFLLGHDGVAGPVNITGPHPVTNKEFTKALGVSLRRPAVFAVPAFALRVALGSEMVSESYCPPSAWSQRLLQAGFSFADGQLAGAFATALDDRSFVPSQ